MTGTPNGFRSPSDLYRSRTRMIGVYGQREIKESQHSRLRYPPEEQPAPGRTGAPRHLVSNGNSMRGSRSNDDANHYDRIRLKQYRCAMVGR